MLNNIGNKIGNKLTRFFNEPVVVWGLAILDGAVVAKMIHDHGYLKGEVEATNKITGDYHTFREFVRDAANSIYPVK